LLDIAEFGQSKSKE